MNSRPISHGVACATKRQIERSHPTSQVRVVGSNGNFYVEETRNTNGIDQLIMHGRPLGRHKHQKRRRVAASKMIHPVPKALKPAPGDKSR